MHALSIIFTTNTSFSSCYLKKKKKKKKKNTHTQKKKQHEFHIQQGLNEIPHANCENDYRYLRKEDLSNLLLLLLLLIIFLVVVLIKKKNNLSVCTKDKNTYICN